MSSKRHALLFGLNYHRTPRARLRGCINDINNVERMLRSSEYNFGVIHKHPDTASNPRTTHKAIIEELEALARASVEEDLEAVWIHYSGHGCSVRDNNGDETDRMDECLVPSDYNKGGLVRDDEIKRVLRLFNAKTRVVCIFDCCHSGTIADLKYRFFDKNRKQVENKAPACDARIVMLSGCLDRQTSADAFNVNNQRKFTGAMTSCLLESLKEGNTHGNTNVFVLLDRLRNRLVKKRFRQIPQLTCSYDLGDGDALL